MRFDYEIAASLLSQLGNITRLKIVRELVRAGDVGLIRQEREGTVLRCFINYDHIDGIVSFLTEECCAADPAYIK